LSDYECRDFNRLLLISFSRAGREKHAGCSCALAAAGSEGFCGFPPGLAADSLQTTARTAVVGSTLRCFRRRDWLISNHVHQP
jgi:hypothetical protein